ncbi:tRNA (adenosine(37)-N6)-dimethylallyltransferase MiaA [Algivirga pacifica]|uniref:tRNA dimethylallyltransferase n=1 Tax=Algivirga pacifica TaxID=1162670 RepID=A0ABP9D4S8_9BACT
MITGPTASGKTAFAAQLARQMNTEIISADSRQVYREMDLGTGKDYQDYWVDGIQVPVHLLDIHDPGYKYNVHEFVQDFWNVYASIWEKGKIPILCGGTGMYIDAILRGYGLSSIPVDEELRDRLQDCSQEQLLEQLDSYDYGKQFADRHHRKRTIRAIEVGKYLKEHPDFEPAQLPYPLCPLVIGMHVERETRRERITQRLYERVEEGMIEEVQQLMQKTTAEDLMYYGLEYKFITQYLLGALDKATMLSRLETAIHRFAKRQMTWFRKMEKDGVDIHWIPSLWPLKKKQEKVEGLLKKL